MSSKTPNHSIERTFQCQSALHELERVALEPFRSSAELRMIALAPKTETLYCVAFVDRDDARRIISLRRANRREVKHYAESI